MTAPRRLALCADDFGLALAISAGIARLAHAGRLNAISCLTNGHHWASNSRLLDGLAAEVDIGLHLNFTEGRPLSAALARHWPSLPSLPALIARAHLGALPHAALRAEVQAQLEAFVRVRGVAPAFVDGHQHVHHLPMLRGVVLELIDSVQPRPAVRSTGRVRGPGADLKRWLIERTGGRALARALARRGVAHNAALLGAYDFIDPDYRALMQGWLAAVPAEGGLLFCHPGDAAEGQHGIHRDSGSNNAPDAPDVIAPARLREAAYFGSAAFIDDLGAANVSLGRVWRVP